MLEVMISGSPFEIGLQHGQVHALAIRSSFKKHCLDGRLSPGLQDKVLEALIEQVEIHLPDLVEEAKGIAQGAGLSSYKQIMQLTFWQELEALRSSCTLIGFAFSESGPVVGKTVDTEMSQKEDALLQIVYPSKGYNFIGVGKLGTSNIEVGINEKGLSVAQSSAMCVDGDTGGVSRLLVLRSVLQYCSTTEESIKMLSAYRLAKLGQSVLLADAQGDVAIVEMAARKQLVRRPYNGVIYATNFYLIEEMAKLSDPDVWYYQNALKRLENLKMTLESGSLVLSVDFMRKILRSHTDPGAICQHGKDIDLNTFCACLLLPREKKIFATHGHPCQNDFIEYVFLANPLSKDV